VNQQTNYTIPPRNTRPSETPHVESLDSVAVPSPTTIIECSQFDEMGLKEDLLRGIYGYGFEKPSIIQQKAVTTFASGQDLIAQAQSGTGKTATYSIGMLQQLDMLKQVPQALVLVPTRELATQVASVIRALGEYLNVKVHESIGGTHLSRDYANLPTHHVIVATPGRIEDMIRRGAMPVKDLKVIILDEADEMLSKGFSEQIQKIFRSLPKAAQVGVFSATLPPEVLKITEEILHNPVKIIVKREELTLAGIRQYYIDVGLEEYKLDTLCDLYETISVNQSVIFCNSRRKVEWLASQLQSRNFPVVATHGQLDARDRTAVMGQFKLGGARVLITTDLLARGIDVHQVSVVINYDLPIEKETYLHRIGRSGRFGRKGVAINFITKNDVTYLRDLEKFYDTHVEELPANVADSL